VCSNKHLVNREERGVRMSVRTTSGGGDYNLSDPINSFADVVRRVILSPTTFFAELPRRGNLAGPLVFALICIEISAILGALLGELLFLFGGVGGTSPGFNPNPQNLWFPSIFAPDAPVVSIIIAPIVGTIGIVVAAGIQQLLVRLVVGATNSGFGATFRVASYTQVTNLVNWIPIVGPLLALYGLYLSIVGIREMHQTTTSKAALVVLLPFGVVLLVALVVLLGAVLF
jgi:hypothetical protein